MANTILTPTAVTREALRILHEQLSFVGSCNMQYDSQFAQTGAKIGSSLKVRKPNKYTVRTGKALSTQDTTETSETITMATQKGVDVTFSTAELTLELQDFSDRVLKPAMSVLAADIEADAWNMYKDVYNQINNHGSAITFNKLLLGRKALSDGLAPRSQRCAHLSTQDNVDLVDALKGLFHDSSEVSKQYREGYVGKTAGFGEIFESTYIPRHTAGAGVDDSYLVNGASQTGADVTVDGGSSALAVGDVFTIAGVNRVHPETKVDTGALQQFTVTAVYAGGAGDIDISPSIITSGATQTVSGSPADNAALTFAGTASTAHDVSLVHHKDAFAFVSADLEVPNGVDFAKREVFDGISMRIIRDYTISDDEMPCRIDVLYGYKTLYAELAARLANN